MPEWRIPRGVKSCLPRAGVTPAPKLQRTATMKSRGKRNSTLPSTVRG